MRWKTESDGGQEEGEKGGDNETPWHGVTHLLARV